MMMTTDQTDAPPYPPYVRAMKRLVFAMGITMISGMVILVYLGITRTNIGSGKEATTCKDTPALALPAGTIVPPITMDGDAMLVTIEQADGTYIHYQIDACSGEITRQFSLTLGAE